MAHERGLVTAAKKDSQGICFVGQIGIRDFLKQYVDQKSGDIIDTKTGKVFGQHDGAIFFTLGQRHGMDVGGGLPYYVVGKDMDKNEVYVSTDLNDRSLWQKIVKLSDVHWISEQPVEGKYLARVRHQAPLVDVELSLESDNTRVAFAEPIRALTVGQSVVIYEDDTCLGGGIVL